MADRLLCATLAIPIPASRNAVDNLLVMDESGIEKQRRLATLLMLPCPPTRQSLVKDLVSVSQVIGNRDVFEKSSSFLFLFKMQLTRFVKANFFFNR